MPRPQTVIENPILNAPFDPPARHFRFDDEWITDHVVEGRRLSSYFMPINHYGDEVLQVYDVATPVAVDAGSTS